MRKASLTQERRERLTAALPDEHFGINDVKSFGEIFPGLRINEHRESDGQLTTAEKRPRWILVSVTETRRHIVPTSIPQCSRDCHEWADTESVVYETDVNSADLQVFARSELEALSAGVDDIPAICRVLFTHTESSSGRQVVRLCSKELLNASRRNRQRRLHPRWRSVYLLEVVVMFFFL